MLDKTVTKSDALIYARYDIETNEHKLLNIAYALRDKNGTAVININDVSQFIPPSSLKKIGEKLIKATAIIRESGEEKEIYFIQDFSMNENENTIKIQLSDDILKHLL